jgi:hypothetical protein
MIQFGVIAIGGSNHDMRELGGRNLKTLAVAAGLC